MIVTLSEIDHILSAEAAALDAKKRAAVNTNLKLMLQCGRVNSTLSSQNYKATSQNGYVLITDIDKNFCPCSISFDFDRGIAVARSFKYTCFTIPIDMLEDFIKDIEPMFKYDDAR